MADALCTTKLRSPLHLGVVHVAVGHKVFSFGGKKEDLYLSVHVFNTVSLKYTKLFPRDDDTCYKDNPEVPCMRWAYTGVAVDNVIYILGGRRLEFCENVLHAFDVNTHTWLHTEVSGTVPDARYFHAACVFGKFMYIFGGLTEKAGKTNDTYTLDTTTMVWSLVKARGTYPPASYGQSVAIVGTKMFVFGCGSGKDRDLSTVRVYDRETNHWQTIHFAEPNTLKFAVVHFAYDGELYTFGDYDIAGNKLPKQIRHLWKSSPESETLSWKKVEPRGDGPFPNFGGCCCVVGDRVVIFGDDVFLRGGDFVYILDFSPSLKTLCQLSVIQCGLEQSELPHILREELAAMTLTDDNKPLSRDSVIAERFLDSSWPVWRHF